MEIKIKKVKKTDDKANVILLCSTLEELKEQNLTKEELEYIKERKEDKAGFISINQYKRWVFIQFRPEKKKGDELVEELRKSGAKLKGVFNSNSIKSIAIINTSFKKDEVFAYLEGIVLSHYTFLKYFKDKKEKENKLAEIKLLSEQIKEDELEDLFAVCESVYFARTLVNEPLSYLNATKFADEVNKNGTKAGVEVEVLGQKQIESLKMGGILAVNQGSSVPPNLSILTWKPENHKNKKPIILVGKGIVYDTGGLSLKPTASSMDYMKSDMGGAAVVAATLSAVAKLKLPYYVIGLIPATDNAIGNKAYVPGDVITMYNKKTVEVLNTDAEGRLILADALSYASKYKPELVIDIATLTGAAAYSIGHYALVAMGTAPEKTFSKMEKSSKTTHERIARFPFWDDYKELLKSDIADVKNIGGRVAGAITAGKFLEYFTDYPWMHFDIAGPAYLHKPVDYYTSGGTGFGVRLLVDFIRNY